MRRGSLLPVLFVTLGISGCTGKDDGASDSGQTDTDTDADTAVELEPCVGRETGTGVGDCAEDFTRVDSSGQEHSLYDFAGDVLLLDFSGFT